MSQELHHDFLEELETLARLRGGKTTTIIAEAVQIGLNKLREETILDQYLKNQINRKEAIRLVGLDSVKLAEKQREAVLEDVKWGLHGA